MTLDFDTFDYFFEWCRLNNEDKEHENVDSVVLFNLYLYYKGVFDIDAVHHGSKKCSLSITEETADYYPAPHRSYKTVASKLGIGKDRVGKYLRVLERMNLMEFNRFYKKELATTFKPVETWRDDYRKDFYNLDRESDHEIPDFQKKIEKKSEPECETDSAAGEEIQESADGISDEQVDIRDLETDEIWAINHEYFDLHPERIKYFVYVKRKLTDFANKSYPEAEYSNIIKNYSNDRLKKVFNNMSDYLKLFDEFYNETGMVLKGSLLEAKIRRENYLQIMEQEQKRRESISDGSNVE